MTTSIVAPMSTLDKFIARIEDGDYNKALSFLNAELVTFGHVSKLELFTKHAKDNKHVIDTTAKTKLLEKLIEKMSIEDIFRLDLQKMTPLHHAIQKIDITTGDFLLNHLSKSSTPPSISLPSLSDEVDIAIAVLSTLPAKDDVKMEWLKNVKAILMALKSTIVSPAVASAPIENIRTKYKPQSIYTIILNNYKTQSSEEIIKLLQVETSGKSIGDILCHEKDELNPLEHALTGKDDMGPNMVAADFLLDLSEKAPESELKKIPIYEAYRYAKSVGYEPAHSAEEKWFEKCTKRLKALIHRQKAVADDISSTVSAVSVSYSSLLSPPQ